MENEIKIDGLGISKDVISTVVKIACSHHDGVESLGENVITNQVKSLFGQNQTEANGLDVATVDNKLALAVHLNVFYGYQLKELASEVRKLVVDAINAQIGVEVSAVDVFIDNVVIPKN